MLNNPIIFESLRSVLLPALVSVALLLAVWRPFKRDAPAPPGWALAAALGAAVIAGRLISKGWGGFWPVDTTRRFWLVVLAGVAAGVVASLPRMPKAARAGAWTIASVFGAWALSAHKVRSGAWEGFGAVGWVALCAAAMLIGVWALGSFAGRRDGRWGALVLSVYAAAASVVSVVSLVAVTSQSMGVVSAWCGMLFGVALLRPGFRLGPAAGVAGLVIQSVLLIAYLNSPGEPPHLGLGLALLAPLALAIGPIAAWVRALPAKPRAVLEAGVAVLLLGLAAYAAHQAVNGGETEDYPGADLYG